MDPITVYEKRDELRRVLQSKRFAKAKKKSRFLEFVCEQTFLGNAEKLNEYLIGVEVYERGTDFDPQQDPIVRVQAHEIRRALKEYYEDEGKNGPWRIELPPGHYVPVFSRVKALENLRDAETSAATPSWRVILRHDFMVAALAVTCLILGGLLLRERSRVHTSVPVQAAESTLPSNMLWFWKPFLPPARPPLIVIPSHPILRAAHDGDTP
ncbi:MAG: hypothetical protein HYS61_07400, partial [Acidobacteria bacterium]|nr:hypothetical protein [Acidobacteriota bacterium]